MSKPFWSKSTKNDDDDISSTHLFWSSLPQLEFDPSVTSFKSLLDIFWAGHDPTVPAYSRHVYNILSLSCEFWNTQPGPQFNCASLCDVNFKLSGSTCRQYSATAKSSCILHASRWNLHRSTRRKKSKLWSNLQAISTRLKSESYLWEKVKIKLNFSLPSYHQKYILQKHGTLLTSIGLSRGPKLVASSLAARLNGYLGGYGTKVLVFGFPCGCIELIDHSLVSCLNFDMLFFRRIFWEKQILLAS